MKKIVLTVGLLVGLLKGVCAQTTNDKEAYEKRKLKIEEVNLVAGYYGQDGNNSAVTGGIGTEKLSNFSNSIDLKLSFIDRKSRQHFINADFNIDHYTSASSDNIDPLTISSASRSDTHVYPSLSWTVKDDATRTSHGLSYSYSTEYDYQSHGFNVNFAKISKDNNREFSLKAGAFFDTWMAILPSELRPAGYGSAAEGDRDPVAYKPRNSYNLALSLSQVINKRLQLLITVEPAFQQGLLSTPYHRVYFTDGSHTVEKLPGSRFKLPVGARLSYFLGDKVILRGFYRFYADDWGMKAHTANFEATYKITPFVSVSPFYRFHNQTAVRYFNAYGKHRPTEVYYTSDYDISGFTSHFVGTGIRVAPPGGLFGIKQWHSVELRYGHYLRSTGMVGNSVTLAMKLK
ncbi:DUF3570 domain-containing protein [Runella salmonicolor]|uniref:DUF3570 domain-containing protein n=1 Tax=Runella salmonicolor TaxID=2950278 RepID=A0ABT1FT58_9BACT|nr:DUF3570 domain-containing protein [Runella salmonicolor]MCP1384954.1 DUF3570 domain-containing protein [Runella salmonicolor]